MLDEIKDVHASVWVSASAGSGKTKSLIDRILALLLSGARPSGILCLTYTKAAASEMLSRLTSCFEKWNSMSDELLSLELQAIGFCASYVATARELFLASMTSKWVRVQTIHSFCFELLEKFPLETGLLPNMQICDDYTYDQLLESAVNKVLVDERYYTDFSNVAEYDFDVVGFIKSFGMDIKTFIDVHEDFHQLYADYFEINEVYPADQLDELLIKKIFNNEHQRVFLFLANELMKGGKKDIQKAQILAKNAEMPSASFVDAFFTQKGERFRDLCSAKLDYLRPELEKVAQQAQLFLELRNKMVAAKINGSCFSIIKAVFGELNHLKQVHHYLDYNDVILNALSLLKNIDWVMYKTNGVLNHILIDEAQDTSPKQWELIKLIADEFFSNYRSEKTLFVVGDEKQSIYSFQGADVDVFKDMHAYFKALITRNGQRFHDVELKKSYRSLGNILRFVDDVFQDTFATTHDTNRDNLAGVVDIVDPFVEDDDEQSLANNNNQIANYIAKYIKSALDHRCVVGNEERAARPADFLILFQRRSREIMMPIIDALKSEGIPVAGLDRIYLKDELIIEDLIALAEFVSFPLDDLMCARVLKSPIVGMTEDELMRVCLDRQDKYLWEYLQTKMNEFPVLQELANYVENARSFSVYRFFSYVLTHGCLEKFIRRLGDKILDTLYEFLEIVMKYEYTNIPSVSAFLSWFRSFDHEMKRESFGEDNAVRLMTVHASKGLQAPFVILADTQFVKTPQQTAKILKDERTGVLLWNFSTGNQPDAVTNLYHMKRKADFQESNRLLYVALTRAENYLCIIGKTNKKSEIHPQSWYAKLSEVGKRFAPITSGDKQVRRLGNFTYSDHTENTEISADTQFSMPEWFYSKLPLQENELEDASTEELDSIAVVYGNYVHMLLCELPNYPDRLRKEVAIELAQSFDLSDDDKSHAMSEVFAVLQKYPHFFDKNSRAEVTFMFNGIEGRIDRLIEEQDSIIIVDFKSGNVQQSIPQEYAEQLQFYKRAISQIKKINADQVTTFIIWTKNCELMECRC